MKPFQLAPKKIKTMCKRIFIWHIVTILQNMCKCIFN